MRCHPKKCRSHHPAVVNTNLKGKAPVADPDVLAQCYEILSEKSLLPRLSIGFEYKVYPQREKATEHKPKP